MTASNLFEMQSLFFISLLTIERKKMVPRAGIEPTTNCLEGSYSIP